MEMEDVAIYCHEIFRLIGPKNPEDIREDRGEGVEESK